jgi:hypothetical protein
VHVESQTAPKLCQHQLTPTYSHSRPSAHTRDREGRGRELRAQTKHQHTKSARDDGNYRGRNDEREATREQGRLGARNGANAGQYFVDGREKLSEDTHTHAATENRGATTREQTSIQRRNQPETRRTRKMGGADTQGTTVVV